MQNLRANIFNSHEPLAVFTEAPNVLSLIAWLHRDTLIAALDREIDTEADDDFALSPEARQQQEAETMGDLLAIERDESALVWRAQAEKLPVEHRADCSPLAVLSVKLVAAPAAANGGTSPGWSSLWGGIGGGR
jgi:hypothetical protein